MPEMIIRWGAPGEEHSLAMEPDGDGDAWYVVYATPGRPDVRVGFETEAEARDEITWLLGRSMHPAIDIDTL